MASASVPQCLFAAVPILHPPHLAGEPSLATEILPGPPSMESLKQLPKKVDPKKPVLPASYLPLSDPGTTYTGLSGGAALYRPMEEGGAFRKRARMDRGSTNRTQRATARSLAGTSAQVMLIDTDASPYQSGLEANFTTMLDDEQTATSSRSTSIHHTDGTSSHHPPRLSKKGSRRSKGKERAEERKHVLVKEEPVSLQLSDLPTTQSNEEHCSSCSSMGALVYCDGCPRAFHPWCLDPPMDPTEFSDCEDQWYCPGCRQAQNPPSTLPHKFLSPLLQCLQSTIPTEFKLPEDVRSYFRDVGAGPQGAYMDSSSVRIPRLGRHGLGEERDSYKLKDHKGSTVLCFRCGLSALPSDDDEVCRTTKMPRQSLSSDISTSQWRAMISCDFCPLHWHVDCLDPPLSTYPPFSRKWKCPNHADTDERKRVPKTSGAPIDITDPNQFNSGNIEVIASEEHRQSAETVSVDEVLINGRKYRVPERIIILDFWEKLRRGEKRASCSQASFMSSPLTSLTSSEDGGDFDLDHSGRIDDTYKVAELLCQIQDMSLSHPSVTHKPKGYYKDKSTQTESDNSVRLGLQDTEQLSGLMKAAFKNLDRTQEAAKNGHSSSSSTRSTPIISQIGNTRVNSYMSRRLNKDSPNRESNKTKVASTAVHATGMSIRDSALAQGQTVSHSIPATDTRDAKAFGSPLKIRIPGRLQQKLASTTPYVASDQLSSPVVPLRPRRSLRRQASTNGVHSDRSVSLDGGHSV